MSITPRKYHTPSGWNAIARHRAAPRGPVQGDLQARFAVVGAGYAGLAAASALALRYPDERIVLLDAGQPAESSSGRNSGFMLDLPYAKIASGSDPAVRDWQARLLAHGMQHLRTLVEEGGIDCGWQAIGHYKAATTALGAQNLEALTRTLDAHGVHYRRLAPGEIKDKLGTARYTAALWLRNCTLVQPAELVHGLVDTLPPNVDLYTDSPVSGLRRRQGYELQVGPHRVRARQVLLCVGTELPAFGHAASRQLAVFTYAGLTRALTDSEAAALGGAADWGVTPVERLEATSRKVGGRRYMLRLGFSYKSELAPEAVRTMLQAGLRERYPGLPADAFEHAWGGAVGMTRNDAPIVRQLAEGLHAVAGCNASGILKMTALGSLLADHATGVRSPLLDETLQRSRPGFIPPEPIRRLAFEWSLRRMRRELAEPTS
jgi:glycine/D-amino acid oxidase-like deaminating enzyme